MKRKTSSKSGTKRQKLSEQLDAARKLADSAKKHAKLAKLSLRNAKDKYKDAKKAAKKAKKVVAGLKAELAALSRKKSRVKKVVPAKPAAKSKSAPASTPPKIAKVVAVPPVKVEIPADVSDPTPPAPAPEVPQS